jgi:hypothetical protein
MDAVRTLIFSRRISAAIGTGFIWAAAWAAAGIVPAWVARLSSDLPFAFLFAPFGFVTGILFSAILGVIERRRKRRMSLLSVAGWAALTGVVVSAIFPALRGEWQEFVVFGPCLAIASVAGAAISRTATSPRRALP